MGRMQDKVALVTGAASGIGLACAERLAAEGARVVLADIDAANGSAQARRLAEAGLAAEFVEHDVACEGHWSRVIGAVLARHGRLDALVNNAGIARVADVELETLDGWRETMAVNLDGVFLGTQAAIRAMRGRGGSIVNISSIDGIVGEPLVAAYTASKGGVRIFTKSAALHCARQGYGIRVNSVHPGFVMTPMVAGALAGMAPETAAAFQADLLGRIPLKRLADPIEIAHAVLFLASDESGYMTGAELVVDGGYTAR